MSRYPTAFLCCLFFFSVQASADPECPPLYDHEGTSWHDWFGYSTAVLGDQNGDGVDDYIIGWPGIDSNKGRCIVFSGADGDTIRTHLGVEPQAQFGYRTANIGDVNNDTIDEYIVSAPGTQSNQFGWVYLFSGADGSLLRTFTGEQTGSLFGFSASSAGDVNGNGINEIIIASPDYDGPAEKSGKVYVFSAQDGSIVYSYEGTELLEKMGFTVATAGKVDSDTFDDFMVTTLSEDTIVPPVVGVVSSKMDVYSGATGLPIYQYHPPGIYHSVQIGSPGDLNGDGHDEFMTAHRNGFNTDSVFIFSGATGDLYMAIPGDIAHFGRALAPAGDHNNDGVPDILIGSFYIHNAFGGRAHIYSGADGTRLCTYVGESDFDHFGWSVASNVDFDQDGIPDVLIGAPWTFADHAGRAAVFLSDCRCGDANNNGIVDIADMVLIANFYFSSEQGFSPVWRGDFNGDYCVGLADIVGYADFIFRNGDPPSCPTPVQPPPEN